MRLRVAVDRAMSRGINVSVQGSHALCSRQIAKRAERSATGVAEHQVEHPSPSVGRYSTRSPVFSLASVTGVSRS